MNRHERRRSAAMARKRYVKYNDLEAQGIVPNRMTLGRWIAENEFPAPVELGPNSVAWIADEVDAWLASRPRRIPRDCREAADARAS
jgi:predicted DNA-binding transcriptional regulator AlpA